LTHETETESKWEEEPLFVRNRIRHLIFQEIFIIMKHLGTSNNPMMAREWVYQ